MRPRFGPGMWLVAVALVVAGTVSALAAGRDAPSAVAQGRSTPQEPSSSVAPTTAAPASTTSPTRAPATGPPTTTPATTTTTTRVAPRPVTTTTTTATRAPATSTTAPPAPPVGNTAGDALNALNRDRVAQGLPALRTRADLQAKAQAWAEKMARENALYHSTLSDGLAPCWTRLGENIAPGSSVAEAEQVLMRDPPHRANILGRWDWVGVGVARTPRGVIVVQAFMSGCL